MNSEAFSGASGGKFLFRQRTGAPAFMVLILLNLWTRVSGVAAGR